MSTTTKKLTGVVVGLALVIPLVLLMFISPASRATPHDVPIGVVGPDRAVAQVAAMLDEKQPGAFEVTAYTSAAELQSATRDRRVYGGFVVGQTPETVIATGASPAVATMLTEIGEAMPGDAAVVDVAESSADDARGAGFGSMVLPVFMTAMALGMAAALVGRRRRVMAVLLPIGAAAVGATAVGVGMWVGVLTGGFGGQWLAMSMGIWATSALVAGLVSAVGPPGAGLAALIVMLVGMPLAGMSAPPEFLPSFWGLLGQSLPLGATGTALRGAVFFNPSGLIGAGAGTAFLVLIAWIAVGYGLMQIKRSPRSDAEGPVSTDAAAAAEGKVDVPALS